MEKEITGVMMYYYKVCRRKLWYFYHEIEMEHENEDVQIGKALDEETYRKEDKHINIDNVINIDFLHSENTLHEIKKSRKIEEASVFQVKYYLYYLRKKDVKLYRAKIDYPLLKKTLDVELTPQDAADIEEALVEVKSIVQLQYPPELEKKRICRSCAYHDLCFI